MRWLGWLVVCASACAGPDKMAWPLASPAQPSPVAKSDGGAGGGLTKPPPEPIEPPPVASVASADVGSPHPDLELPNTLTLGWPVAATGVNSLFGHRRDPVDGSERFHAGVDLEAEYGAVVSVAAAGWVARAGWHAGHGRRIIVDHAGGFQTVYSHLAQVLAVSGTRVRAGEPIGRVGNSGRSTGPHLHFEVSRWGKHLDPLDYLGVTVRLD